MGYVRHLKIETKNKIKKLLKGEEQQSSTLLAPEIGFLEGYFSMGGDRERWDGFRIILTRSTRPRSPACTVHSRAHDPMKI